MYIHIIQEKLSIFDCQYVPAYCKVAAKCRSVEVTCYSTGCLQTFYDYIFTLNILLLNDSARPALVHDCR